MSILGQVFTYMLVIYAVSPPAFYVYCVIRDKKRAQAWKSYPASAAAPTRTRPEQQADIQLALAAEF